jgi:hypothetical protein
MIVPCRKPIPKSQINIKGNLNELKKVLNDLLYSNKDITILPSGNASIYVASKIIDYLGGSNVLIPDMGGWKGFMTYPKMSGLNVVKLRTNYGIVNCELLEDEIKKNNIDGLFLTSLAGYLARQPLNEIRKICEDNNVIFVEDISGGVGGFCGFGDIIVCSTGTPKVINCEYGGFIGIGNNIKNSLEENKKNELKQLFKTYKVPNIYGTMKEEALMARKTYKRLVKFSNILKDNFENAYYKDNEGICVFLECNGKETSRKINSIVELDNGKSLITKCPLYERILREGIVIEIKKTDIHSIDEETINELIDVIKNAIVKNKHC